MFNINEKIKERTLIMGILNVTPDSFSDGGLFTDVNDAVDYAKQMVADGADIIDIGGESSRPGAEAVSEKKELQRVIPVIKRLVKEVNVPLSIDTYKPQVAEECLKRGAHMVNDITGLQNEEMVNVVKKHNVPVIIMHMKGSPQNMQKDPQYNDVVNEVKEFLRERIERAKKAGIKEIIIDPGIGFGKTTEHNLQIIKRLHEFNELGYPLLVGLSRKSFIGQITGLLVNERLEGTIAANVIAIMNGAEIIRVHDVKECKRAVLIADALRKEKAIDKIVIKDACFQCHVGVTQKERSTAQDIVVDVELFCDIKKSVKTQNIKDTINYSEVHALLKRVIEGKEHVLIETIAEESAHGLLGTFNISAVTIRIKKPGALKDRNVHYAGVEISRRKNG